MNTVSPEPRGELAFVRRLRTILTSGFAGPGSPAVPFGDDMCSVAAAAPTLLWTVDMLMDGVDFDSRVQEWFLIGRKAMAVNLSDCAAMAVEPVSALCAVALTNSLTMEDALELMRGAQECGQRFGCPIVGGDTNSWDAPTVVSISIAARCPEGGRPVPRDGARPGDSIWLTGRVGGSILGRHLTFEPKVELALRVRDALGPHAMIDVSDGLSLDLARILEASGCGAVLDDAALDAAIHPDAVELAGRDGRTARAHALSDGEDFELVVVLPPDPEHATCRQLGLLPLGRIVAEPGLSSAGADGKRTTIAITGWEHFR